MNFIYFFFHQSTVLSSGAVDGHQMYFGGSVLGKASTIGIDISLTPPLIVTGGGVKKCKIWRSLKHHSTLSRSRLKNAARYPNSKTKVQWGDDRCMPWPSLVKLGPRTPEKALSVLPRS